MSQHGFSYATGAASASHPPPPLPQPAAALYSNIPYQDPAHQIISNQSVPVEMTQHAFNQNRNLIPGLGFGMSHNVDTRPQQAGRTPQQPDIVHPSPRPVVKDVATTLDKSYQLPTIEQDDDEDEGAIGDNELEEGELSEGEVEETYEPPQHVTNKPPSPSKPYQSQRKGYNKGAHSDKPFVAAHSPRNGYKPTAKEAAQRRGQNKHQVAPNSSNVTSSPSSVAKKAYGGPLSAAKAPSLSVTTARKNAQDAILRLWPLNIRFSDYLNEGIDKQLLKTLFEELGLDVGLPVQSPSSTDMSLDVISDTPISPANEGPSQPHQKQPMTIPTSRPVQAPVLATHQKSSVSPTQATSSDAVANTSSIPVPAPVPATIVSHQAVAEAPTGSKETPKDNPLEERKDRIARLLAAKGSKQAAAQTSTPSVPMPTSVAASDANDQTPLAASAKALSEKSKLLQQKMEALRKARELQTPKTSQPDEEPMATVHAHATANQTPDAAPSSIVQKPALHKSTSMPPGSPMPNLRDSASPNLPTPPVAPRAAITHSNPKRPAASDLNDMAETIAKRPFGQTRKSQPFLIDVSEDDDDAAMDLDSPELEAASLHRPSSPFKIPSLHSFSGTPITHTPRQANTLGAMMSTLAGPTTGLSKSNLESMNKEIEMMKLRIAEAEARKKARASRTGSPSGQLSNENAVGSSPNSRPLDKSSKESPMPMQSATPSGSNFFGSPPRSGVESPSRTLPKQSKMRNAGSPALSRSRAASERLPVIAAHRREQLLKLEALQSQIAKIEKEIAESMKEEEEALRLAAMDDELENDGDDDVHMSEDTASQGAAPMETDSEASSEEADEEKIESPQNVASAAQDEPSPPKSTSADESTGSGVSVMIDAIVNRQDDVADEVDPESHGQNTAAEDVAQQDAVTDNAAPSQNEHELPEGSEGSEPIEPDSSSDESSDDLNQSSDAEGDSTVIHHDKPVEITEATPVTSSISTGQRESKSPEPAAREDQHVASAAMPANASNGDFVPYDSPLQYFHAYRFHPQYQDSVSGGLRSLTYSNKIDVRVQLCPDQLAGTLCPRGNECDYQHFESFEIPDDQILVQLGAYEGDRKSEYIDGLKKLLTDFRVRKVKDFKTISQGILDYRAQFRNDNSKILPLGTVSL